MGRVQRECEIKEYRRYAINADTRVCRLPEPKGIGRDGENSLHSALLKSVGSAAVIYILEWRSTP